MTKSRPSPANSIRIVFASLFLCLFAALPAFATDGIYYQFGLDLGYAGRIGYTGPEWAIYVYGAGTASNPFKALDISAPPGSTPPQIDGNTALAGVYSTASISGQSVINGDIYRQTTSKVSFTGNAHFTPGHGQIFSPTINSQLTSGINSLKTVSITAAGLTPTAGSPTSINLGKGQNVVFNNSNPNNPFDGKYVMNLTDFVLSGKSTLTLKGAAGTAFVLNISGSFNINGGSKVLLTGGLTVSDVLFNVAGSSANFSINGDSEFNGTLLAYNSKSGGQRELNISGHNTVVNGEVLVNRLVVQSGAHVKKPKEKSKEKDDDDDVVASNSLLRARTSIQ